MTRDGLLWGRGARSGFDKEQIDQEFAALLADHEASVRSLPVKFSWGRLSCCGQILCMILSKLKFIICLLTNRWFGLKEIKKEIKDIECKLDNMVPPTQGGAITTGPFLVRAGENNLINVKVQNTGEETIRVDVFLYDVEECPPEVVGGGTLAELEGGCCVQEVSVVASAGNFEVVVCPDPAGAPIRAFVSVHSGNAVTSAIEYVFRVSEMLPAACGLCEVEPIND